jgi:hypothetical protein
MGAIWLLWVLERRGRAKRAVRTLVSAEVESGAAIAGALREVRGPSQNARRFLRARARQRGKWIATPGAVSLS